VSEVTNRRGVGIFKDRALAIEWLPREQFESDQGIDVLIEQAPDEIGNGRLLAVQVKSGESWFRRTEGDGWVFRFNRKKARLWLGHALPVVVVLVDVSERKAYWQQVSESTATSTGKNYKVIVPFENEIESARPAWDHLASGIEEQARHRADLSLTYLPPQVVRRITAPENSALRHDLDVLAVHLERGRHNPSGTCKALLAAEPIWMTRPGRASWSILGAYAAAHGLSESATQAYELAADADPSRRGRLLAFAALQVIDEPHRARPLLQAAASAEDAAEVVAVGTSLLRHQPGKATPVEIDPMLLRDTSRIRGEATVQAFLSQQHLRGSNTAAAVRHARFALDAEPDSTALMSNLAEVLLRHHTTNGGGTEPLTEAISLLETALAQRRTWAGPTAELMEKLGTAYGTNGRFGDQLRLCLESPHGTATADEASTPALRRMALVAAAQARHTDLTVALSAQLGDEPADNLARVRAGVVEMTDDEAIDVWSDELTRTLEAGDWHGLVVAVLGLAELGVDRAEALTEAVERQIIDGEMARLVSAVALAHDDLDAALPTLRAMAAHNSTAAEHLIHQLQSAGRFEATAEACAALYASTTDPYFLIEQAASLIAGAHWEAAEPVALAAVRTTAAVGYPDARARLLVFLALRASERREWVDAERHLTEALPLLSAPDPVVVWRLAHAQLAQGHLPRAGSTISRYSPAVSTTEEGRLWLAGMEHVDWDESTAATAIALAEELDDPDLSPRLLGQVITVTYSTTTPDPTSSTPPEGTVSDETARSGGPAEDSSLTERRRLVQTEVPGELHRRAFEVLGSLVTRHGDRTSARFVKATADTVLSDAQGDPLDRTPRGDEDPQDQRTDERLRESLKEALKDTVPPDDHDLLEQVRDAQLPLGLPFTGRNHGYATALVQRTFGFLTGASADDNEHATEVAAATNALTKRVVIDASALLTISHDDIAIESLPGQFSSLHTPAASLHDIHRASADVRALAGSPGSIGYDPASDSLTTTLLTDEEFARRWQRTRALSQAANSVISHTLPAGDDGSDAVYQVHAAWWAPVRLARDEQLSLWSDDLGQRRFARGEGAEAFGTSALLDALRDAKIAALAPGAAAVDLLSWHASLLQNLGLDFQVDLPLHIDDILTMAEREGWLPGAAALQVSRASWWLWQTNPLSDVLKILTRVGVHAPESLPEWQYAAMLGAAWASRGATLEGRVLMALAVVGCGPDRSDRAIIEGVQQARHAAEVRDCRDPLPELPAAAQWMHQQGQCDDPEAVVDAVTAALG
jgi:uncharacterized protein DUF4365